MEALMIMVIGMTSVFIFLLLLILLMRLVDRLAPHSVEPIAVPSPPSRPDQARLVAVIQAAITAYEADDQSR